MGEWEPVPVVVSQPWAKVTMPCEIDAACAAAVAAGLDAAMVGGVEVVVGDMSATTFCDSAGVKVLVQARRRAEAAGKQMRLVVPPGKVRRVFELMGVDQLLPLCGSLDEALAEMPGSAAGESGGEAGTAVD